MSEEEENSLSSELHQAHLVIPDVWHICGNGKHGHAFASLLIFGNLLKSGLWSSVPDSRESKTEKKVILVQGH